MSVFYAVLKSIFLPYLIIGSLGFIMMIHHFDKQRRKIFYIVLTLFIFAVVWRMMSFSYNSSRYSENLFSFFSVCSAYFFCYGHIDFQKMKLDKNIIAVTQKFIVIALVCALFLKFFHYNPYSDYNQKVAACIEKEQACQR